MLCNVHYLSACELAGTHAVEIPKPGMNYLVRATLTSARRACRGNQNIKARDRNLFSLAIKAATIAADSFMDKAGRRHHLGGSRLTTGRIGDCGSGTNSPRFPCLSIYSRLPLRLTATGARPHFKRPPTDERCLVGQDYLQGG